MNEVDSSKNDRIIKMEQSEEGYHENDMVNEDLEINDMQCEKDEEALAPAHAVFIKEEKPMSSDGEEDSSSLDHLVDQETEEDLEEEDETTPNGSRSRARRIKQRFNIKFCVKLKKSKAETWQMLRQAYGDKALSRTQCFRWHSHFSLGLTSVKDGKRSGRPRTISTTRNFQRIEQLVYEDRHISLRKMSEILRIPHSSCRTIINNKLNLDRICGKLVARHLTYDEKQERVCVCMDMRDTAKADPSFISRIVSCGESWMYGFNATETKSRRRNPKLRKETVKSLLIVFFDMKGIVHWEFVPSDQAVNSNNYCEVLKHLLEEIKQKRPELWQSHEWMLHHEPTPFHTSLKINEFLVKNHTIAMPHPIISPTCSPDLLPWDFALFPKLRKRLLAIGIETAKNVPSELQAQLDKFQESDFQDAFDELPIRWEQCIKSQGDYFEEDLGEKE